MNTMAGNGVRSIGLLVCLSFVAGLVGCATPLQSEGLKQPAERRQFVRNYTVGQPLTVNVGEPMVKLQDYWVETTESAVAIPDKTVNVHGGLVDITLVGGRQYPVKGQMTLDGVDYVVVAAAEDSYGFRGVLLKPDGTLHNRVVTSTPRPTGFGAFPTNSGLIPVVYSMTISEPSTRFVRDKVESVKVAKGYENFEILYTGTNSAGLNLTYREFSPDGLARVAFFQNLTYEAGAKSITFKKFRIAVDRASSESITFTVLTDGYEGQSPQK